MEKNIPKDFGQKCENCGHSKSVHYCVVENPDWDDPKVRAGVCKKEDCDCKKFISEDEEI